ncbi:TM2 domain-containing protein [Flavobacteriales bacterium]|nr:TM2 domain-containing protein [Flavobacteriales bacterium]
MKFILALFLMILSTGVFASNDIVIPSFQKKSYNLLISKGIDTNANLNKTKIIAVVLAVTLGVFGVHRLYLGTKPIVPITYTITLGGGMAILPIIDIFYIISAKDINQITNNDFVFMWNKKLVTSP